ncbi:MAG: sensor histidine kinase [Rhabdochlamydiaceae bacterium]
MEKPNYLKYSVSGKIVRLLGRDSVTTDTAALFEIVKNAYDADASYVKISFEHIKIVDQAKKILEEKYDKISNQIRLTNSQLSPRHVDELVRKDESYLKHLNYVKQLEKRTTIIVEDNGTGMTLDQLQNKWMVVGVDKSEKELYTKKGRRVVGEKGVGRFSTEKVAHQLILTSFPAETKTAIKLQFDWDAFGADKELSAAKIPITYGHKDAFKHGLKLELIDLREAWTHAKIRSFINELSLLILPKEISTSHPFSVQVKVDGKNELIEIESKLFKKAPYFFIAELTEDSKIKFVEAKFKNDIIIPNEKDLELYGLQEIFPFRRDGIPSVARCGPVKFYFYGYPFDPSGRKLGWTEFYGKMDVEAFQELARDNSGIKIYRDGFRVRPYGDKYQDWLSMAEEARSTAGRLPSQNVIGWIEISSDRNPYIIDTTTREKIIENEGFMDLRLFANQAMNAYSKFAESKRQEVLKKEALSEVPKLIKKLGERILDDASIPKSTKTLLVSSLNQIQVELTSSDERSLIEKESLMDERNAFRNLASLGIAAGVVSHETNDYLRYIMANSGLLKKALQQHEPDYEQMVEYAKTLEHSALNLLNYMMLVRGFTATLGNRGKDFRKKRNLNLYHEVKNITDGLDGICKEWDIHIENKIPKDFPNVRMFQADLQSIFINLFSNSIKSLRHFTNDRRELPPSKKNRIRISTTKDKDDIIILFSDNGLGIPSSDQDHVFEIFWTRTTSKDTSQSGSGLGLPIIKEIIADYRGKIFIDKKPELSEGVTFKITISKKEILST